MLSNQSHRTVGSSNLVQVQGFKGPLGVSHQLPTSISEASNEMNYTNSSVNNNNNNNTTCSTIGAGTVAGNQPAEHGRESELIDENTSLLSETRNINKTGLTRTRTSSITSKTSQNTQAAKEPSSIVSEPLKVLEAHVISVHKKFTNNASYNGKEEASGSGMPTGSNSNSNLVNICRVKPTSSEVSLSSSKAASQSTRSTFRGGSQSLLNKQGTPVTNLNNNNNITGTGTVPDAPLNTTCISTVSYSNDAIAESYTNNDIININKPTSNSNSNLVGQNHTTTTQNTNIMPKNNRTHSSSTSANLKHLANTPALSQPALDQNSNGLMNGPNGQNGLTKSNTTRIIYCSPQGSASRSSRESSSKKLGKHVNNMNNMNTSPAKTNPFKTSTSTSKSSLVNMKSKSKDNMAVQGASPGVDQNNRATKIPAPKSKTQTAAKSSVSSSFSDRKSSNSRKSSGQDESMIPDVTCSAFESVRFLGW